MFFGVRSDRGIVREINEDSYGVIVGQGDIPNTFIVADGMGGHNSGEVASKVAVEFIRDCLQQTPGIMSENPDIPCEVKGTEIIKRLVKRANEEVYSRSHDCEENFGMGTTLIIAVVWNNKLIIGHVGDSRVYLLRENKMEQVTVDHSYIEELIRNGTITREEAGRHPNKNLITRALGCSDDLLVDTYVCDLNKGDTFMMCTDGLTNMLSDDEIRDIILRTNDPEAACEELVQRANKEGGEDNITVIIVRNN